MTQPDLNRKLALALGQVIVPRYDTMPTAVFREGGLIDLMRTKGFYVAIMMELPRCDPPKWTASFERWDIEGEYIGSGTTVMEAVAMAALEALTFQGGRT